MDIDTTAEMIEAALDYLDGFPKAIRRKGESYLRDHAVQEIVQHESGTIFTAKVAGSQRKPYTVELEFIYLGDFEEDYGWDADCSCL